MPTGEGHSLCKISTWSILPSKLKAFVLLIADYKGDLIWFVLVKNRTNFWNFFASYPAGSYLFKFNNWKTIKINEICPKLTIKHHNRVLSCYVWTDFTHCSVVSTIDFEKVHAGFINVQDTKCWDFSMNIYDRYYHITRMRARRFIKIV